MNIGDRVRRVGDPVRGTIVEKERHLWEVWLVKWDEQRVRPELEAEPYYTVDRTGDLELLPPLVYLAEQAE